MSTDSHLIILASAVVVTLTLLNVGFFVAALFFVFKPLARMLTEFRGFIGLMSHQHITGDVISIVTKLAKSGELQRIKEKAEQDADEPIPL